MCILYVYCIYEHLLVIIYLYLFSLYINVFMTTWINYDTCVIFPVTSLSINGRCGTERLRIYGLFCRFDHGWNVWYGQWLMLRQVHGWVLVCLWVRPWDDMRSWETDCWNCCNFSTWGFLSNTGTIASFANTVTFHPSPGKPFNVTTCYNGDIS